MTQNTFANWADDHSSANGFNPYYGPEPFYRDTLDERRTGWRSTPEAMYPDGYLGLTSPRRGDRILPAVGKRLNGRNYVRGVHKGERIETSDYFWPEEFGLDSGVINQILTGDRYVSPALRAYAEPPADRSPGLRPVGESMPNMGIDPERAAGLRRLLPSWQ